MNILLIRSDTALAGPAKLMHAYAKALRNAGHNVFIASGGGAYAAELEADGFPHTTLDGLRIGARNPLPMLGCILKIRKLMRHYGIGIVNSFNAHAGLLAHLADPFRKAKHFNTVLGTGQEWTNRILSSGLLNSRVIAVSHDVRSKLIAAGVRQDKVSVVYNSTLDQRFFAPLPGRAARTGRVGLCGIAMFTGRKGQEIIIPLMARLVHERRLDLQLTLVGEGASRSNCEQLATELGIADRVRFTGALIDVVPELDKADIFVHLPETETFGIVLAEAMARALPTVTIRVGGIPEVVQDRKTGIILSGREDETAIMDAIEHLAVDSAMRQDMGQNGHERVQDKFSLRALQHDLSRLYS